MNLEQLKTALEEADPAAVLVSSHLLTRLIREVHDVRAQGLNVPHRKSLIIDRAALYRHVEQDDLDLRPGRLLPQTVVLLTRPVADRRGNLDSETTLLRYWRRLFHASVHRALTHRADEGQLAPADLEDRLDAIGRDEFAEVQTVLEEEQFLLPHATLLDVYIEFAAVYLELRYFLPELLPIYFPSLREPARIDALLSYDVDASRLFAQTRLGNLSKPQNRVDFSDDEPSEACWNLVRSAEQVAESGNTVRAAILRTRAARIAPAGLTQRLRTTVQDDLDLLTRRLRDALKFPENETREWLKDLTSLLEKTGDEQWSVEARLLYDLQKACVEHEHEVYTLDPLEWLMSGGKKPIRKPLTNQRLVRIARHLRSAVGKLNSTRLSEADRHHLGRLVHEAARASEERLRARFRPALTDALSDVGLEAATVPELAARHKVTEELLDRIVELGFFTFSDLRDTISRNNLKLPDLSDPQEWAKGDPLLRLDRRLAASLDSVYRPSEVYLRLLQRLTSANFATHLGRRLTRYVTIPLLGALLLLQGVDVVLHTWQQHVSHVKAEALQPVVGPASVIVETLTRQDVPLPPPPLILPKKEGDPPLPNPDEPGPDPPREDAADKAAPLAEQTNPAPGPTPSWGAGSLHLWLVVGLWVLLTVGLFMLMHVPRVRLGVLHGLKAAWRGLRWVFVEWPAQVLPIPALRRFLRSWAGQMGFSWILKPLMVLAILMIAVPENFISWRYWAGTFVVLSLLLNSRPARSLEDAGSRGLVRFFDWFRSGLLGGLLRLTLQVFKRALDALEYVLYTVDEWLRFRDGDTRSSLVVRGLLGLLWMPVSYLLRLYVVVLVEPGVNPVKLPLSILAAKFVYPVIYAMGLHAKMVDPLAQVIGLWPANALVWGGVLWWLPDAFTFLFWEMKENWRLYRANRPEALEPVAIGPHGETLIQLLEPGFHSGQVPKLYAQWREAEREARQGGPRRPARACREKMHELEEALRRFVEREVLALLHQSPGWHGKPLSVARVVLARNLVRIELEHADHGGKRMRVMLAEQSGHLVARVEDYGWVPNLAPADLFAWTRALAGMYKFAGVDLVYEEVTRQLPPTASWRLEREGMVVRFLPDDAERVYELDANGPLKPRPPGPPAPELDPEATVFGRVPLYWADWVADWEHTATAPEDLPRMLPVGEANDEPSSVREHSSRSPSVPRLDGADTGLALDEGRGSATVELDQGS